MNKIKQKLSSIWISIILLLIIAISLGVATFLESSNSTEFAKLMVYNAKWLEILFVLLISSLIVSIFRYKMNNKKKWSILLFHLAFICILAGAAITRHFGYEGQMHIRQGESSNQIVTNRSYLKIIVEYKGEKTEKEVLVDFIPENPNQIYETIHIADKKITIESLDYILNTLILKVNNNGFEKILNVMKSDRNSPKPIFHDINGAKISISLENQIITTPFSLTLRDFELKCYPGSMSPSSYISHITLTDTLNNLEMRYQIYMNNILNYRGYRFFQSSYDKDKLGTILLVNHDFWGTLVSYIGYFFLFFGMIMTLFNKNSRFRTLIRLSNDLQRKRKSATFILMLMLSFIGNGQLQAKENISKNKHLETLNELLVQNTNQGRIEPFETYATDVFRKINKHNSYKGKSAPEIFVEMISNPTFWKAETIIKVSNPTLETELGAENGLISFNTVFDKNSNYNLKTQVEQAYQKAESNRTKYDKEIINVDERINICNMIYAQGLLAFFPDSIDKNKQWSFTSELSPTSIPYLKMQNYIHSYGQAMLDGNWSKPNSELEKIKEYQLKYANPDSFSNSRIKIEIIYNKLNIFNNLMIAYALVGLVLLIMYFIVIFKTNTFLEKSLSYAHYPLVILLLLFTAGLIMRWYISGHAPLSNGYESMLFVGWASSISGLIFARRSTLAFSVSSLLSAIALSVAAMSWMNPEITNLVPVLKSHWLVIHVAVITSSYGFLAMGAILGLLNLILIILHNAKNMNFYIQEISYLIEMTLIVGLILLTIGTFLGGIWANESWGRYWGWDAKETWALISILIYAIVLHLRLIPKLNNSFVLSSMSIIAFFSVIMTFLGVNYYLTGLHSYAQGTAPTFPTTIYLALVALFGLMIWAFTKKKKIAK